MPSRLSRFYSDGSKMGAVQLLTVSPFGVDVAMGCSGIPSALSKSRSAETRRYVGRGSRVVLSRSVSVEMDRDVVTWAAVIIREEVLAACWRKEKKKESTI